MLGAVLVCLLMYPECMLGAGVLDSISTGG